MNKLRFLSILFLSLLVMPVIGQETISLDNFSKIKSSGGLDITLIPSNETKAVVEMIKGDFEDLMIEVKGDRLVMKFKNKSWMGSNNRKAEIDLYYKSLDEVDASAGSKIVGDDHISCKSFEVEASSGAYVRLAIESDKLGVDVSSGASVNLKGEAKKQSVDVSSGASYKGTKMETEVTDVEASSGASAKVYVTKEIRAEASSGGSVKYKGSPEKKDIDSGKYSGGSVKAM